MASVKYEVAKGVIGSGRYELADMLEKLDTMWLQGDVTAEERAELVALAQDGADPMGALPGLAQRVSALEERAADLENRVAALEAGGQEGGGEPSEPGGEPEEEYPAWHAPTGAHDAYYAGDRMTYTDGKRYVCTAPEGYGCTYGPDVLPQYWELVEDETSEPGGGDGGSVQETE